ncbi:MAG: PilZ domain-containing protein [Candidatus Omnitrophica bacterium]|nr:PilZ domain-containing protein [Candidatus Omnitrophota bacterium]MCM8823246.1 PilZ domain-containing protein [Candidatus Omnitrophota bacterium]MCM8827186.1 PilZ domain-containing protein [Candidatus Omnitrophota bacterium]
MVNKESEHPYYKERRKYPRLNTSVEIEYWVSKEDTFMKTVTKNIGAGGVCIVSEEKIGKDTILFFKIDLSDGKKFIQAKGKVVWSSEFYSSSLEKIVYNLGIEFIEISDEDRQRIYDYVIGRITPEDTLKYNNYG